MVFEVTQHDGTTVINPSGPTLEAANSQEFKQDICALLDTPGPVVLDLSRIGFIDSSGCGALLHCQRQAQARGSGIVLCGLTPALQGLIRAIQLERIIPLYPTRAEALAAVGSGETATRP